MLPRFSVPAPYALRLAVPEDVPLLPALERSGNDLFEGTGAIDFSHPGANETVPVEVLTEGLNQGLLWVSEIDGVLAGFCLTGVIDGDFYIYELSVHPAHGRKGLGRALLLTACQEARTRNFEAVYLWTFRDVAWNAPFYARLGFEAQEPSALKAWQRRMATPLPPFLLGPRIFMRLRLR